MRTLILLFICFNCFGQSDEIETYTCRDMKVYDFLEKKFIPHAGGDVFINKTTNTVAIFDLGPLKMEAFNNIQEKRTKDHRYLFTVRYSTKSKCTFDMYKKAGINYLSCNCENDELRFVLSEPVKN